MIPDPAGWNGSAAEAVIQHISNEKELPDKESSFLLLITNQTVCGRLPHPPVAHRTMAHVMMMVMMMPMAHRTVRMPHPPEAEAAVRIHPRAIIPEERAGEQPYDI